MLTGCYFMKRINSDPILSVQSLRSLFQCQSVGDVNSTIHRMRDQIATVKGHRCRFSYIILSRVSRLGVTLLMHWTSRFPKPANHHQHAISERSWVDNMERCRPCLRASCRRRALIKCSLVFSFGLCWCDAREVCGPSAANVHGKEYNFACHRVVQGFTTYPEGYRESDFFQAAPDVGSPCSAVVIVR